MKEDKRIFNQPFTLIYFAINRIKYLYIQIIQLCLLNLIEIELVQVKHLTLIIKFTQ
jgi:hypothetical protein